MKYRTAKQKLIDFLRENKGWHNKSALLSMVWMYDDSNYKSFSPDTIAPKLREACREGLIQNREEKGQTWYAALDTPMPVARKRVAIIENGVFKGYTLV